MLFMLIYLIVNMFCWETFDMKVEKEKIEYQQSENEEKFTFSSSNLESAWRGDDFMFLFPPQ